MTSCVKKVVLACLTSLVWCVGAVSYKRWLPNTNFENPKNWENGVLPCHNDRIVFPEEMPPVFVQINTTLVEIVLPLSGELVFGSDVSFSFPLSVDNDSTCPGQELAFNRTDPKSWFDPVNWCTAEDLSSGCVDPQSPSLASQRIPGSYDTVIFPSQSSFYVDLDSDVDIYISSLFLDNVSHTTGSFLGYLRGEEGVRQFVRGPGTTPTTINIRRNTCDDVSGCATGNDVGQMLEKICSVEKARCSPLVCLDPVLPIGACCHICGGILKLDYGRQFQLDTLKKLIRNKYTIEEDSVDVIVSKTSDDKVQVVFRDVTGGKNRHAMELADGLKEELQTDMKESGRYGMLGVELLTSQYPQGPATGQLKEVGITGRSIAGIVLSIVAMLALVGLGLYCLVDRDRCQRPFNFIRFGKEEEGQRYDLEMHGTQSISFRDLVAYGNEVQGFGNPIYDVPVQTDVSDGTDGTDNPAMLDLTDVTFVRSPDPAEGFTNPLYGGTVQDLPSRSCLKLNPMYSDDGIEEDSEI